MKDRHYTLAQALHELLSGNSRFVSGAVLHPNTDKERLQSCSQGQHPFACVLACSDSRVPVELIFDRGIGDLFVVQVAGNVFGDNELGSMEYAIEHLGVPVLVVMGHSDCGMVKEVYRRGILEGHLNAISKKIMPAVQEVKRVANDEHGQGQLVMSPMDQAARINVWHAIEDALRASAVIRSRVQSALCQLTGAFYWISTGQMEWMGMHPHQAQILTRFEVSS